MENINKNAESKVEKKPEDVIGFLREFNFGDPGEDPKVVADRFVEFIKYRHQIHERLLPGEPSFLELFVDELEKAGFAEPGKISKRIWTPKAQGALDAVLESLPK